MTRLRASQQIQASRAATLLDNPTFAQAFTNAREKYIADLEAVQMKGEGAGEALALETVRKLQALMEIKRELVAPIAAARIAERKKEREELNKPRKT